MTVDAEPNPSFSTDQTSTQQSIDFVYTELAKSKLSNHLDCLTPLVSTRLRPTKLVTPRNAPSIESPSLANGAIKMSKLHYVQYTSSRENEYLPAMRQLISKDLSEPYSIYVYRYFLYQWGHLCFMALDEHETLVGVVVSKLESHRGAQRGYIAMLAVREEYRGQGIATKLVRMAIDAMIELDADEVSSLFSKFLVYVY